MMENEKSIEELLKELAHSQEAEAKANDIAKSAQEYANVCEEQNEQLKDQLSVAMQQIDALKSKKPATSKNETFEADGDTYEVLVPAVHVPGHGKRTALEIVDDEKAQRKLIDTKSGAIKKIS